MNPSAVNPSVRWVVGLTVLGVTLATLAEFPQTEPFAVALAWACATSVTFAYGADALDAINKVTEV